MSIVGPRLRYTLVRYAFATAMTGFVTATSVALRALIQPRHDAPFLLAVLIVAWVVGFGPALLTSGLSIVSMNYFFIPPLHSLRLFSAHELIGAPVFAAVALGMSWLATTRRHAEAERARALHYATAEQLERLHEADRYRDPGDRVHAWEESKNHHHETPSA